MTIITGRGVPNGRPPLISSIGFIARPTTPTYPDAATTPRR